MKVSGELIHLLIMPFRICRDISVPQSTRLCKACSLTGQATNMATKACGSIGLLIQYNWKWMGLPTKTIMLLMETLITFISGKMCFLIIKGKYY